MSLRSLLLPNVLLHATAVPLLLIVLLLLLQLVPILGLSPKLPRVNYFAYGSNLQPRILESRTLSRPGTLLPRPVILPNYKLCINLGTAASVETSPHSKVPGLIYKLPLSTFNILCLTEGYPIAYKLITVQTLDSNNNLISAYTFSSGRGLSDNKTTERYKNILVDGAKENGLGDEWISYLESLETL